MLSGVSGAILDEQAINERCLRLTTIQQASSNLINGDFAHVRIRGITTFILYHACRYFDVRIRKVALYSQS